MILSLIHIEMCIRDIRSGTEEVVSKVLAEKEAGDVLADVLLVADNVTFETLKEQDLLSAYESPELEGIPEIYIDKDHKMCIRDRLMMELCQMWVKLQK